MRIRMLGNADVTVGKIRTALFDGQSYDLPKKEADALVKAGKATSASARTKAVHGPPEDK